MRKAGLIRRFATGFHIPETEITIRVRGKIVYVPGDLDALLAGDERFQTPSQAVDHVPVEDGVETAVVDNAAETLGEEEVHEADPPAAEPKVKAKKQRVRRPDCEHREMATRLHQAVWDAAVPTDDPAWRVITKSVGRQLARSICGNELSYPNLFRYGRAKSGPDHNTCLVADPSQTSESQVPVSQEDRLAEQPTETPSAGSTNLTLEQLNARIAEREVSFSTQAMEDDRARVLGEVQAKREELTVIDDTRLRLRQELRVLEDSKEAIEKSIDTRIMQRQQDQELQDLNWARDNFTRLERILTGSAAKS